MKEASLLANFPTNIDEPWLPSLRVKWRITSLDFLASNKYNAEK
jgi:hypothetical protein